MILTENHTLVDPDDMAGLIDLAVVAEEAGFDAVMISEHLAMGPSAGALGRPVNPREYAAPGNQDPAMAWPSSIVLASAVAARTRRIRIVLGAIIAPLRHPVALAKELATLDRLCEGRLVVQPTVSWHRDEYRALGVPFDKRGRILDEVLEASVRLWHDTPATYRGEFFDFEDVYSMPKPFEGARPSMWFGGQSMHPALLRRLIAYGDAFHPFGEPSAADLATLRDALVAAGRDVEGFEMVGGTRAAFDGPDTTADLMAAMETFEAQASAGFRTFCMKPSQHTDDPAAVGDLCRRMVDFVSTL
ncbi:MAG: TIGR03619 family F420-dependent LLM class oxidoreductase [Acidimicrobiales bacterium]